MFKTLCLSKLKPTPLRPMACRYCSPSYRNLRWVSVYTWDVTSDHSDPEWSADHGCPDLPIPDISANFAALWEGMQLVARENQDGARRIREAIWIKQTPYNMNRDGGAYQLSDIYDEAIAKTTTSGAQKIGGLLQSANQRPRKMSEL